MNTTLPGLLNISSRLRTRLLYIAYATIFAVMAINSQSFPYFGWMVIGVSLVLIVWRFKSVHSVQSHTLLTICFFNALTFGLRTDGLVLFFAFISYIYCLSWAILPEFDTRFRNNLGYFLFAPLVNLAVLANQPRQKTKETIQVLDQSPQPEIQKTVQKTYNRDYSGVIVGVIIALFTLLIILPLLYFSNAIFATWVDNFFKFWNFQWLVDLFNNLGWLTSFLKEIFNWYFFFRLILFTLAWSLLPRIIRLVGFGDFDTYEKGSYFRPRTLESLKKREKARQEALALRAEPSRATSTANQIWLIPKVVIAFVVGIFILAQLQLYISPSESLVKMGYNLSKYSNEIFFQLSVVSTIIVSILYFDLRKTKFSSIASIALLVQVTLLTSFALRSVWVYIANQGFTQKRLYGIFVVIFLLGLVGYFAQRLYKNLAINLRTITIWLGVIFVAVAGLNFNYIIYHLNPSYDQRNYINDSSYNANSDTNVDSLSTGQRLTRVIDIYRKYNQDGQVYYRCNEITTNSELVAEVYQLREPGNLIGFNIAKYIASTGIKKADFELLEKITGSNASKKFNEFILFNDAMYDYDVAGFEAMKQSKSIQHPANSGRSATESINCTDYTVEALLAKEKVDYSYYTNLGTKKQLTITKEDGTEEIVDYTN